jgi:adenylate cyclase
METRNATIFFAETKNDTKETLFSCVQTFRGKLVKTIGTTHLFIFDDPQAACESALKLKRTDPPIPFRIGISRGVVSVTNADVFGDVVNLAARLQGIAKNQEVFISDDVREAVDSQLIPVRSIGKRHFSGGKEAIPVFSLETSMAAARPVEVAKPEPTEPEAAKPSKEYFDFSRVDQERIQEDDSIRAAIVDRVMATGPISLANDQADVVQLKRPAPRPP